MSVVNEAPEKVHVLVVDDRPENVLALEAVLSDESYHVVTAASGAEALKQILRFQFAVILLDVLMPGMDGFEVARLIAQRSASQDTPIIFLTAAGADVASIFKGYSLGAVDYLVKPVDANIVRAKVAVFADLFRKTERIRRQEQLLREADRARSEQALREREAEYEATFERAASGIAHLRPDGRWLRVNQCLCDMLGYTREELSALKLQDVAHPEQAPDLVRALRMLLAAEIDTHRAEARYVHKNGAVLWINTTLSLLHTAGNKPKLFVAVMEDVTAQKRADASQRVLARASEALLEAVDATAALTRLCEAVVPSLADACIIDLVSTAGSSSALIAAHSDPTWHTRLRDPELRPELSASIGAERIAPLQEPLLIPALDAAQRFALAANERGLMLMNELNVSSLLVAPLMVRDRVLGSITWLLSGATAHAYDANDRTVAEDLAHRVALALENWRLYAEAQTAVRVRDEFLSIASHELRTPITPLHIQLQRMLGVNGNPGFEAMSKDKLREILVRSAQQVSRLGALVDSLLDVSRLSAGRLTLDLSELDLSSLAHEVVERFSETFAQAGCKVSLQAEPHVTCHGDRLRLEQVLTNLLSNAQRYGSGNPVEVRVSGDRNTARLLVQDQGVGIAAEKHELIFDRFERGGAARNYGGLGLGLFIARQIVEAHGGTIRVQSELHKGSTFTVELARSARVRSDRPSAPPPAATPPHARPQPIETRTVLLVEDDTDIRDTLGDLLRHIGHAVVHAANGLEALRYLEDSPAPDVILLDLMMPVMDGWQFRSEQRRKPALAQIPVIVVSGDSDIQQKAAQLEATGYLRKPTNVADLLAAVANCGTSEPKPAQVATGSRRS